MGRTDEELIAACRAGDAAAFGQIVERYQPVVVAVAYAAVRDRVLAEDIAQDAFVTAWTKLAGLRDVERLPAWLCGIARNVARARRRVRGRELPETDVVDSATPFTALDDFQTEAALAAALARVPATYREPLVLFYCEQQPAHEVARALGVSDAAVHQRLSRGRALLARDAELCERARPRSRRDLAAAVLAAIAVLAGGSSRVNANPRGMPMFKFAALALTGTVAAGTTYVVTHNSSPTVSAAPSFSTSSSSPRSSSAATRAAASQPWFAAPARPTLAHGSGAPITCVEVAQHMAELALADDPTVPAEGPERDKNVLEPLPQLEAWCEQNHWSQEYMACVLGSSDAYSQILDCSSYEPHETAMDPDAQQPAGTFVIESLTDPIPATNDTSCAGVARHMADLTTRPDPAFLAKVPADHRDGIVKALAAAHDRSVTQAEKGCTDTAWTEARRRCIAAATTMLDMAKCE
jgi:RNA polymerase sigma factor (sigma-70 family)